MIIRSKEPKVLEYPFESLDSEITPNDKFYVRSHFPEPVIDRASWVLAVEGEVATPLRLSYEQLLEMPSRRVVSTLECAGNNRLFLRPPAKGVQWELGGTSTAEWTGVSLAHVLERAGVRATAVDVVFEGADIGTVEEEPKPDGPISFARSLPMAKAIDPDVLLCYQMNGETLSMDHGYPLRAIVPGWYAMASVKWLTRINVIDRKFDGYFQTTDYAYWTEENGNRERVPISQMLVKAEISHPQPQEVVPANSEYVITGAAWSGEGTVTTVEISVDNGKNWSSAQLTGAPVKNAWRFFEYCWQKPQPGQHVLIARATDSNGNTQPLKHDPDRGAYMINFLLPIPVEVR